VVRVVVEDMEGEPVVLAVVHRRQDTERPVVDLVKGQVATEVSQGHIEVIRAEVGPGFSPRSLNPILDGGEGNEDPVVTPEVPTGVAIGQAVLGYHALGDIKNILSGTSHRLPSRHKCHLEFILCIRQQDDLHS